MLPVSTDFDMKKNSGWVIVQNNFFPIQVISVRGYPHKPYIEYVHKIENMIAQIASVNEEGDSFVNRYKALMPSSFSLSFGEHTISKRKRELK